MRDLVLDATIIIKRKSIKFRVEWIQLAQVRRQSLCITVEKFRVPKKKHVAFLELTDISFSESLFCKINSMTFVLTCCWSRYNPQASIIFASASLMYTL